MLDIPPAYLSDSFNAGLPRSNVFVCVEMYISPFSFEQITEIAASLLYDSM